MAINRAACKSLRSRIECAGVALPLSQANVPKTQDVNMPLFVVVSPARAALFVPVHNGLGNPSRSSPYAH